MVATAIGSCVQGLGLALAGLVLAAQVSAAEVDFRLDSSSFIREADTTGAKIYTFPASARVRFAFGRRAGDTVPVTIAPGGLLLGVVRGEGLPPLEFELAEPATGTLTLSAEGAGSLVLEGKLLVKRIGAVRPLTRDLTLEMDLVPIGTTGKGYMQITSAGDLARDSLDPGRSYLAVIGGTLDSLPAGVP